MRNLVVAFDPLSIPTTRLMHSVGHQSPFDNFALSTISSILPGPLAKSPPTPAVDCPTYSFEPSP